MADKSKQTTRFACRARPSVVVHFIGPIEVRIGETKWQGVAYMRNGELYARTVQEFALKFEEIKS